MKFGKLFKKLRVELGLTQMKMAKKLKTNQAVLSKIETGRSSPSVDVFLNAVILAGKKGNTDEIEFNLYYKFFDLPLAKSRGSK